MKQGTGRKSYSDYKVEPNPKAVNPGYTDRLGQAFGNHSMEEGTFKPNLTERDAGRGYSAPSIGTTSHKKGSQGRY